jgi:serine/threonine-protein kinase
MNPDQKPASNRKHVGDRFGELGVALGILSTDQVIAGLQQQQALKAQGHNKLLGEILMEQHILNPRTHNKILLEQQRRRKATAGPAPSGFGGMKKVGDYELESKLGEGGMGAVFKAKETISGRIVALKILNKALASDGQFLERFKREAKASGAFNHPNIVAAYGSGEADGIPYLAMEYIDGESLNALRKRKGHLNEIEALTIVKGVAAGLGHAHKHGFVHRDVKPDNILIGRDGSIKVTDLGLAKSVEDEQRLTKSGIALGTPHYISPEQARGEREVDARSDIYSLGASLYVLLTGQVPFDGKNNNEILLKHLKEDLDNPQDIVPEISDATVNLISRMMAKKRAQRHNSCDEVIQEITRILNAPPGSGGPSDGWDSTSDASSIKPPKKHRRPPPKPSSSGGCMVVIVTLTGLVTALHYGIPSLARLCEAR